MKPADIPKIVLLLMPLMLAGGAGLCSGQDGSGFSFGDADGKNASCLACHGDARKVSRTAYIDQVQFGHTTHAVIGCPTCHAGLSQGHPDGVKTPPADCRECHPAVSEQYGKSIHAAKTHCAGCHNPHKVDTPKEISGQEINQMCAGCHDGFQMIAKHSEWLPQSDLHLRMLPCITCHTSSKNYFISMYIIKGKESRFGRPELASYDELLRISGGRDIVTLIDTNGDKYVSLEELRMFNRSRSHTELRLQGMMTPETVSHSFEILDSRRNCTFCHTSGSGPMQTSFISLPVANGTFTRVPVERGAVLDALYGTPDFYMMGSTKNSTLNGIGLAIICGGLIMPVGHGFMRFMTRKNRKGKEH